MSKEQYSNATLGALREIQKITDGRVELAESSTGTLWRSRGKTLYIRPLYKLKPEYKYVELGIVQRQLDNHTGKDKTIKRTWEAGGTDVIRIDLNHLYKI